jgi:DNA-binding transcriptional MerR regulator
MATLKFYLREGLIAPTRKTGRTRALYDASLVVRIQTIRELQARKFLPLSVIRETLRASANAEDDLDVAQGIADVIARRGGARTRSRADVLARGASAAELEWLARAGLAVADRDGLYRGDDLSLLSLLGAARAQGLTASMLPFSILAEYFAAMNQLVAIELKMFRAGVVGRARGAELRRLTVAATRLSERLVVLIRRKLLLPTLEQLAATPARSRARPRPRGVRRRGR